VEASSTLRRVRRQPRTGAGVYRCSRCRSERTSRRIYDLRHTFSTNALAAGIAIFELARYTGTSVAMIDRTYGHLAQGSEDLARAKPDRAGQEQDTSGESEAKP
jgi:integrase